MNSNVKDQTNKAKLVEFYTNSPPMAIYISMSLFGYNINVLRSWALISMGLNQNISQGY
jgi:hypothetical protein